MSNIKIKKIYNITNILLKYNQHLDPISNEATTNLKLKSLKKYLRRAD